MSEWQDITTAKHEWWDSVPGGWKKGPMVEIKTNLGRELLARRSTDGWVCENGERLSTTHDRHYFALRHERPTHWRPATPE